MSINLGIISPAYYKSERPIKYLLASAEHQCLIVGLYGWGKPYTDWIQTHIDDCLERLRQLDTSHVLFTDAVDAIFLKPKQEIINRYMRLGHPPMLVSMEMDGLNAGGWIGEREVAIAILRYLQTLTDIPHAGNPQERWRYAEAHGKILVMYDVMRTIFSVNEWPTDACILHLAGGYSDPVSGRAERIEPVWKELGYEPVP